MADAYDGKSLWLLVSEEHLLQRYLYGEEPPAEQAQKISRLLRQVRMGKKLPSCTDYDQSV